MASVLQDKVCDGVGTILLNRPAKRNAINKALACEFLAALKNLNADDACRVIVIGGAGRSFCAGDDLHDLATAPQDVAIANEMISTLQEITKEIMFNNKPVVCGVQGWAVGAGFSWVLNADISVWAEGAGGFLPELKYGMFATGAATYLLPERIGRTRALEMMASGRKYGTEELDQMGLVGHIVPEADLQQEVARIARDLAALDPDLVGGLKLAMSDASRTAIMDALNYEQAMCEKAVGVLLGSSMIQSKTEKFRR